jgi:hypothetical protein
MDIPDEKKIEIFYDHYKDTFNHQLMYLKRRNLYTIISLVLIALLSFQVTNPAQIVELTGAIINKQVGDIKVNFSFIFSVLLFGFLWVVMLYFQVNLLIERNYTYIHTIEKELSKLTDPVKIYREGSNYLDFYPLISSLVHRVYTIFFPTAIVLVSIITWLMEKKKYKNGSYDGSFIFDTGIILIIIILTMLYLLKVHFNDFKKSEIK